MILFEVIGIAFVIFCFCVGLLSIVITFVIREVEIPLDYKRG